MQVQLLGVADNAEYFRLRRSGRRIRMETLRKAVNLRIDRAGGRTAGAGSCTAGAIGVHVTGGVDGTRAPAFGTDAADGC
jgi:hypothetical protein